MPLQSISWLPIHRWDRRVVGLLSSTWMLCWAVPGWCLSCAGPGLCGCFACLDLKAMSSILSCVCLRTKTRPPLLGLGCVLEQGAGSKLHKRSVQRLCNLGLILAVGYGWKLKLSANVFCISAFLKYFTCCVHMYLSPSPSLPFSFSITASDMKKDIESLIAQEKAEIVAKYEKVPASCLSPTCWLGMKLFNQLGMHQITFASLQALPH